MYNQKESAADTTDNSMYTELKNDHHEGKMVSVFYSCTGIIMFQVAELAGILQPK